jgi:hypothetical protein
MLCQHCTAPISARPTMADTQQQSYLTPRGLAHSSIETWIDLTELHRPAAAEDIEEEEETMAPTPTLGCQIAPSYNHEEWPYSSDTSSDDGSQHTNVAQEQVAEEQPEIEKAETARDTELIRPAIPTPMQSFRTRASRKVQPQEPVGFWHWSMVCLLCAICWSPRANMLRLESDCTSSSYGCEPVSCNYESTQWVTLR